MKPRQSSTALPATPAAEFKADEWNGLTGEERIQRCLLYAHEATLLSTHSPPEAKEAYIDLCQQWLALAAEIENGCRARPRARMF